MYEYLLDLFRMFMQVFIGYWLYRYFVYCKISYKHQLLYSLFLILISNVFVIIVVGIGYFGSKLSYYLENLD